MTRTLLGLIDYEARKGPEGPDKAPTIWPFDFQAGIPPGVSWVNCL